MLIQLYDVESLLIQYRDKTWFFVHKRLPGPKGDVKNRGLKHSANFSTAPERHGKQKCIEKQWLIAVIA